MDKSQQKLLRYFEKRLQETDKWIERIKNYPNKHERDVADLYTFQGARGELITNIKYIKGDRWKK